MTLNNGAVASWLRQTTTAFGLALLPIVATAALAYLDGTPLPLVFGSAAAAVLLMVLPGQGDLAGKLGALTADGIAIVQTRTPDSMRKALVDLLALIEAEKVAAAPGAPAIAVVAADPTPPPAPATVTINTGSPAPVAEADAVASLRAEVAALAQKLASATMGGVSPILTAEGVSQPAATPSPALPLPLAQAAGIPAAATPLTPGATA